MIRSNYRPWTVDALTSGLTAISGVCTRTGPVDLPRETPIAKTGDTNREATVRREHGRWRTPISAGSHQSASITSPPAGGRKFPIEYGNIGHNHLISVILTRSASSGQRSIDVVNYIALLLESQAMSDQSWHTLDGTPAEDNVEEFYWLWIVATVTYGVGDIVTTIAIVDYSHAVSESNPLLSFLVTELGWAGLVSLKLFVFLSCIGISVYALRTSDRLLYYFPPVFLSFIGASLTGLNIFLLWSG